MDDEAAEGGRVSHVIEALLYEAAGFFLNLLKGTMDGFCRYFFRGQGLVTDRLFFFQDDLAMEGLERHGLIGAVGGNADKFS